MVLDFKESSWYRVEILTGKEKETIKFCKNNIINYPSDIVDAGLGQYGNTIDDTSEQLMTMDNDGCETITLLDDNGNEIWSNRDINVKTRDDLWKLIAQQDEAIEKLLGKLNPDDLIVFDMIGDDGLDALKELKLTQESRQARENWR